MNLSQIFLSDGTLSPTLIIWLFYIAVVIGTIVYFAVNYRLSKIIARLLELDATSPETAVSIADADLKNTLFLRACLRSPASYKNLLVAITSDGKYYANMRYGDTPPVFKELRAISGKNKSKITENGTAEAEISDESSAESQGTEANTQDIKQEALKPQEVLEAQEVLKAQEVLQETAISQEVLGTERVKFQPLTAKYYIPKEIHDKVKGTYKSGKVNVYILIGVLIGLGVIAGIAGYFINDIIDMLLSIAK